MSQYRPIIGIPCRPDISGLYPKRPVNAQNQSYSNAVLQAGGIPLLIPVEVAEPRTFVQYLCCSI